MKKFLSLFLFIPFLCAFLTAPVSLPPSGVTPGSYTSTNLTVNAQGIITAAANGSGGGGGISSINSDITSAQLLSVGSAGTNFAIVDAGGGSHVFNLPTASSVNTGKLSSADWLTFSSKQPAGSYITALTGDVTAAGPGSSAATLATVNSNVGSFGSSTSIPSFTVNAKGLITAASGNVVIAPAGTLSGTVLNSTVITSSLQSLGVQSADLDMGTHQIHNVVDPTSAQDAATKNYVDTAVSVITPTVLVTTDASPHTVYSFPVANNTAYLLDASCVARRTDAPDRGMFEKKVGVYQESGGGAIIQGAINSVFSESSDATWSLTWVVSAGNAILQATGAAGKTIDWTCSINHKSGV